MGCGASNSVAISPAVTRNLGQAPVGHPEVSYSYQVDNEKVAVERNSEDEAVPDTNLDETDHSSPLRDNQSDGRTEDCLGAAGDQSKDPSQCNTDVSHTPSSCNGKEQSSQTSVQSTEMHALKAVCSKNGSDPLEGVPLSSALHSPSPSNQKPLDRETVRPNTPRAGTAKDENQSAHGDPRLVANTPDESSHTPASAAYQCQHRTAVLVRDVPGQATSKCSSQKDSDLLIEGMCHDQLITPTSATLQGLVEQSACYSLSQSFTIQSLQLRLGFIGSITVDPK